MKKVLLTGACALSLTAAGAQVKGKVDSYQFDGFKLHVYYTNDVMGDASYIVEGNDGVVTLEQPLFKDNVAEFDQLLEKIGKKVSARIASYHLGGTAAEPIVMAEGMADFSKGPVYGGMMKGFAQMFGDAIVDLPTGPATEVAFGSTQEWAGVKFVFSRGASTDFPAASILIGGKVYYTHWTPARAHANVLQISSAAAVDAEIAEAEKALKSGAELFIGGHGGAAEADVVRFKIEYLNTVKRLLAENATPETFISSLKAAYRELPGEDGLEKLAAALYK